GRRRSLQKTEEILCALHLQELASRPSRELSIGEMQMVALARALVLEPEVLLLDEPTANLDPARVGLVEAVVRNFRARSGCTIIWATHNLFQAKRVADRVALLLDGRLVETAPRQQF